MTHPEQTKIEALLNPKSIAVIGVSGSPDAGPTGATGVFRNLIRHEYGGKLCAINPNHDEIQGLPCYKSITDVPGGVDLAIIGVGRDNVVPVLRQCVEAGCKSAVIITAGFGETSTEIGLRLERELKELVRESGILVCGPNCLGVVNVASRVAASATVGLSGPFPKQGRVAVVSQSGSLSSSLITRARDQDVGLAYVVSCGNEIDREICDYVEAMAFDPDVDVVISFVEGFKDLRKLRSASSAMLRQRKPWIVYKVGKSELSASVAKGHTGSIVGVYDLHNAFFRQHGIVEAESLDDLLLFARLFAATKDKRFSGRKIGILSCSGGSASILADLAKKHDFQLSRFTEKTVQRIDGIVADWAGAFSNPIDPGPPVDVDPDGIFSILDILHEDAESDLIIHAMGPRPPANAEKTAARLIEFHEKSEKPFVIGWYTSQLNQDSIDKIQDAGSFVTTSYEDLFRALEKICDYRETLEGLRSAQVAQSNYGAENAVGSDGDASYMSEFDGKLLCQDNGIAIPRAMVVSSLEEARRFAEEIGYPVTLKINSAEVQHKSEIGGVFIDVGDAQKLAECFGKLETVRAERKLHANFLVEEFLADKGCELIVSVSRDEFYGPFVLVGLGGYWVEAAPQNVYFIPPVDRREVERTLRASPLHRFIAGESSRYHFDFDAVVDIVLNLQEMLAKGGGDIQELEINPLLVRRPGKGAVALDVVCATQVRPAKVFAG